MITEQNSDLLANGPTEWRASQRTRQWLLFGLFAALIDAGLQIVSTVLELKSWDQKGLTADTAVGFMAILPQMVLLLVFLRLARDVDSRGMWKSATGFFACGWLGLFLSLALYEMPPRWLTVSVSIVGGVGILALVVFLFGKWPTFQSVDAAGAAVAGDDSKDDGTESKESEGTGCVGHLIIGGILVAIRILLKNNRKWLAWVPASVESFAFLEMLVVLVLTVIFVVWFAVAKIRLRHKLGEMSVVLGVTELFIVVLHFAGLAVGLAVLIMTAIENPNIDDAEIGKRFDSWGQTLVVVTGASYCLWSFVLLLFFASVRNRSEPDWRVDIRSSHLPP